MRLTSRALLSMILIVAFSGFMFAAPLGTPVVASASGATVNTAATSHGSSLKVGDRLSTSASGSAMLNFGGSSVTLGHLTSATVEAGALHLVHGLVRVNGSVNLKAGGVTATPANRADYEFITLASGRTYVAVYSGSVTLSAAKMAKPVTVKAGSAVSFDGADAAQGPASSGLLIPLVIGGSLAAIAIVVGYDLSHNPASSTQTYLPTSPSQ